MTSPKSPKPSAADRTVDMFSVPQPAPEEVPEAEGTVRLPESIEAAAERWRANAIFTAEHFSKHYDANRPETSKFRLTSKDGNLFLEKFSLDVKGEAYHWAGLMFRESDLYELTSVFVKASKAKQERDNGVLSVQS